MTSKNVYVGHRYVPKIEGVWDKLKSYEGLSIVLWEGTSYTSKKMVPEGVDISNEEYWVVSGNYNAQVEHYRQDVRDMEDRVGNEIELVNTQLDQIATNINKFKHLVSDDDWSTAFTEGLNYIKGTNGKLYIPNGVYNIPNISSLNIDGVCVIEGESENAVLNGSGQDLFTLTDSLTIRNVTFKNFNYFTNVENSEKLHLEDCIFDDVYIVVNGQGSNTDRVKELIIKNCKTTNIEYGVVYLRKVGVHKAIIRDNIVDGGSMAFLLGDNSTYQHHWQDIHIIGNTITNLNSINDSVIHAIIVYGENVRIENNTIENLDDVDTVTIEAIYTKSKYNIIRGNYILDGGKGPGSQGSIVVKGRPRNETEQITPNGFMSICAFNIIVNSENYQAKVTKGISIDCEDVLVFGNMIRGITSTAIDVAGTTSRNVSVSNNTIIDIKGLENVTAITAQAGNDIKIHDNTIYNVNTPDNTYIINITPKSRPMKNISVYNNSIADITGDTFVVGVRVSSSGAGLENVNIYNNNISCKQAFSIVGEFDDTIEIYNNKLYVEEAFTTSNYPTTVNLFNNKGLTTENKGEETIISGETYVSVYPSVGNTLTLERIQVTPSSNLEGRSFWITMAGQTAFRINIDNSHTSDLTFNWSVS